MVGVYPTTATCLADNPAHELPCRRLITQLVQINPSLCEVAALNHANQHGLKFVCQLRQLQQQHLSFPVTYRARLPLLLDGVLDAGHRQLEGLVVQNRLRLSPAQNFLVVDVGYCHSHIVEIGKGLLPVAKQASTHAAAANQLNLLWGHGLFRHARAHVRL